MYTILQTMDYLKSEKFKFMTHCLYSVDLAPYCFLFLFIKNKMHGQHFNSSEKAVEAYKCHISIVPLSGWHKCFQKRCIWMQKCINTGAEILRSNETYILGEKPLFVFLSKNLLSLVLYLLKFYSTLRYVFCIKFYSEKTT